MQPNDDLRAEPSIGDRVVSQLRDVLGVAELPLSAGFIELGGNSLLANVLINRLDEEFGLRPRMIDVLRWDIGDIANWAEQRMAERGTA